MEIKIIRSERRLRTVSGRMVKGTLLINAPLMLSQERLEKIILDFKLKFEKKRLNDSIKKSDDLAVRASRINEQYFGSSLALNSIKYVTDQNTRFGCCNYQAKSIRISQRIGLMPEWVRDYVVLHEMAHLVEPNHSKAFWDIVNRYKFTERARGYLMAAGLVSEEPY